MCSKFIGITTSIVAAGTIAFLGGCWPSQIRLADLPECPHSWETAFTDTVRGTPLAGWGTSGSPQSFLISGMITDIPEFHDCQRLIPPAPERMEYGRLGAVFARFKLDSVLDAPVLQTPANVIAPIPADGRTRAIVEIVSEQDYPTLGIKAGFNCLLLHYQPAGLAARMVAMGPNHQGFSCVGFDSVSPPDPAIITSLNVQPMPFTTVPAVARWEWDVANKAQLLGAKCARNHWCTFGTGDMRPEPPKVLLGAPVGLSAPGWYDEQYLAEELSPPSTPSTLSPSRTFATVIPDIQLESFRRSDYPTNTWIPAAYVMLPDNFPAYTQKLGLRRTTTTTLAELNRVELCLGSLAGCQISRALVADLEASGCSSKALDNAAGGGHMAWGRVIPPGSESDPSLVRYHCVAHRQHPGVEMEPTARWRWKENDETIWIYCPAGCCELHSSLY